MSREPLLETREAARSCTSLDSSPRFFGGFRSQVPATNRSQRTRSMSPQWQWRERVRTWPSPARTRRTPDATSKGDALPQMWNNTELAASGVCECVTYQNKNKQSCRYQHSHCAISHLRSTYEAYGRKVGRVQPTPQGPVLLLIDDNQKRQARQHTEQKRASDAHNLK